jgi:uncharacterized protein (TIGR02466 family)
MERSLSVNLVGVFPTPVLTVDTKRTPTQEEIDTCIEFLQDPKVMEGNFGSKSGHVLNERRLDNIKSEINTAVSAYSKEVLNLPSTQQLYITQSWLTATQSGGWHTSHLHSNSLVSGVYYVNALPEDSINFHKNLYMSPIKTSYEEPNEYVVDMVTFPVQTGHIILFPSNLYHDVRRKDQSDKTRIALAFNVFVRGKLGTEEKWDELILP